MGMSLSAAEPSWFAQAHPSPEALALRYRVYCEEFDYLPACDYPSGLESDEDDATAAHIHLLDPRASDEADIPSGIVASRGDATLAGYARLVRPDANGWLPVQRRCNITLAADSLPSPTMSAEVSRLIIAPEFRRQKPGGLGSAKGTQIDIQQNRRKTASTELLLHLFRGMASYSYSNGIRYWFAAMERPLARSLAQMGFPFKAAGPEGEFFGRITPYVADLHELQDRVTQRQPLLAQWLLPLHQSPARTDTPIAAHVPDWAHRPPPPPQLWSAGC